MDKQLSRFLVVVFLGCGLYGVWAKAQASGLGFMLLG